MSETPTEKVARLHREIDDIKKRMDEDKTFAICNINMQLVSKYEAKLNELANQLREAQKEQNDIEKGKISKLYNDLVKEYGVEGSPKLKILWSKCWELGHANGLSDVEQYFRDLVELIK